MSTAQCRRLTAAFRWAIARPNNVIVLRGGSDFWSNGIHLNLIEAAESPADASWDNIMRWTIWLKPSCVAIAS
jgi:putative two-component system hydrogenase maturation factor HypX/HoxX